MRRVILALVLGFVTWFIAASVLDRLLRAGLAGYAAAEPTMAFTLPMMWARLAIGALASLLSGALAGALSGGRPRVAWLLGGLLVLFFIPVHVQLWHKFPPWYHGTFLLTLAPLVAAGVWLMRRVRMAPRRQPLRT
jgi:hypothetical protein